MQIANKLVTLSPRSKQADRLIRAFGRQWHVVTLVACHAEVGHQPAVQVRSLCGVVTRWIAVEYDLNFTIVSTTVTGRRPSTVWYRDKHHKIQPVDAPVPVREGMDIGRNKRKKAP